MALAHYTMQELEKHFICVSWDQRHSGKSFKTLPDTGTLTIKQFVEDTITLIELLLKRFQQPKLFLIGHSWGSILAFKVARARPDLLYALIGTGQVVDMKRGEELSYYYVLERARQEKNHKALKALEKIGAPPYTTDDLFIQRKWLSHYKGDISTMDTKKVLAIALDAHEYSAQDFIRLLRGFRLSIKLLWNEIMKVNLQKEIQTLAIPFFFFVGRHDYMTPFELVEEYYQMLNAPLKQLIWFEHSAHIPDVEEPEKFQRELLKVARLAIRAEQESEIMLTDA